MQEYVIQIDFIDYPGLGYEIFKCTEQNNIDKIAMEVLPKHGMVIKFRCEIDGQVKKLMEDLKSVVGVNSLKFCAQMPYEEREHELRTILDSVSEGILAIDKEGKITHVNEVACKIFYFSPKELIGLGAEELLSPNSPILDTLQSGKTYKLKEQKIKIDEKIIHYLMSSVAVRNDQGKIIGAVSTIKDFHQVENIISRVGNMHRLTTFDDIVYQSQKMNQLIASARTVAKSSSTILLRGESGTGKELFATAIHADGPRYKAPFIAINCTALADTLLESELFGYDEGAFTGALRGGKRGLFEQANGGTLFLDEIGEISHRLQVKLLRVLQEGVIRRVGGNKEIPIDVRIIAATHRNLEDLLEKGEFRRDLYYRLNVIPLTIAPLRERKEDIPLLVQRLIRKICEKLDKPEVRLSRESLDLFMAQDWPGNVRQLENTLERLLNLTSATEITSEHVLTWTDLRDITSQITYKEEGENILQFELPSDGQCRPLKNIVAEVEKEVIKKVLKKYPSSRLAGQALGVSNTTILNKMKIHKIMYYLQR
ncbi:sigma 54-interacting transcriptional regulator [Pelosinus sp. IPA-1]|uniref:sigma-54 interaction domain-containing protein n=1 Tax=Pelosinus sp. IPA-1 TaxID=3029569 RepID=UPI0024362293|nr:sigma 54-interacting transcriptional regulator [Pelosinus sp. IPA-1]GMA97390.1 diguanylate cyclase [Pelosinus sp. IPA-1]